MPFVRLYQKGLTAFLLFFSCFGFSQTVRLSNQSDVVKEFSKALLSKDVDSIVFSKKLGTVVLPPILIKGARSKTLYFEPGIKIRAKPGFFTAKTDCLFKILDSDNITINGGGNTFSMNKSEYTEGEWRHGFSILSSKEVTLTDLTIEDSGGDGIYVSGNGSRGSFSEAIHVTNVISKNNKRQGISLISVDGIEVSHSTFTETKGTLPGSGVDIEPNNPQNVLNGIHFIDCTFSNNDHAGIQISLNKQDKNSVPVSICFENCLLENNHSESNKYTASEITISANRKSHSKGKVEFIRCIIQNSKWGVLYSRKPTDSFQVVFTNCVARKVSKKDKPVIALEVPDYYTNYGNLGGFVFDNFIVEHINEAPVVQVRGSNRGTLEHLENIKGTIILKTAVKNEIKYINYNPDNNINVELTVICE